MTLTDFYKQVSELVKEWQDGADPVYVLNMICVAGVQYEAAQHGVQPDVCQTCGSKEFAAPDRMGMSFCVQCGTRR
jgi:hypothetical protein